MRLILIGFGQVGQWVARILQDDIDSIVKNHGFTPQVVAISDTHGCCVDGEGLDVALALKTKKRYGTVARYPKNGIRNLRAAKLISENEAEVVIETTPSNFENGEPGLSNIKTSLATGKHVVTANKGPLALAMPALVELAEHKKVKLRFSGTVGGGTPFLDFVSKCLPGEKVLGISGILNGTTNYILSRMEEPKIGLSAALKEAQEKGFAEADPSSDIQGLDAAAKLVIVANSVLGRRLSIKDVQVKGISGVTPELVRKALESGNRIRLVCRLQGSLASVKPEQVGKSDPICVSGTLNALTFSTEHAGDVTLVGAGAGGENTAGAILRDLVDIRGEYFAKTEA